MITLSLCMIVKNEEKTLARCLGSMRSVADEIIIVDTGSTDRTKQVAAAYTDRIYDFEWIDDFAAARNFANAKATMDYILWLDADDILPPAEAVALRRLKAALPREVDAVMMRYATEFDHQGRPAFSYYRERLAKRERGFLWKEPVHEYLEVSGVVLASPITVFHAKRKEEDGDKPASSGRNLRIYERLLAEGQALSPRGMYYYARELRDHQRLQEAVDMFTRFLDTGLGWAEDTISACQELARLFKRMGEDAKVLPALFRSFAYDAPRAETCCQIGYYFEEKESWRLAAFWFELALELEKPQNPLGFTQHDLWGYTPAIECAVCYDKLNDLDRAERFNERAAAFQPDSLAVAYNRRLFAQKRSPERKEE